MCVWHTIWWEQKCCVGCEISLSDVDGSRRRALLHTRTAADGFRHHGRCQGDFKIAHCGGFHSFFNTLIKGINLVAKLLHHNIRWDTETIGCDPRRATLLSTLPFVRPESSW